MLEMMRVGEQDGTGPVSVVDDRAGGVTVEVTCAYLGGDTAARLHDVLWPLAAARLPDDVTLDLADVQVVDWESVAMITAIGHRMSAFGHRLVLRVAGDRIRGRFRLAVACGAVAFAGGTPAEIWLG